MGRLLDVLIASRSEMFLNNTIQSVLAQRRGDTGVVVVLDGGWPVEPIPDHPDVTLIFHAESIGQRAAINEAANISRAEFVMKLDAHEHVDEGFDVKLAEPYRTGELTRADTTIPRLYNLHAFSWICQACGNERYQGPTQELCVKCGGKHTQKREIVWKPRLHKRSDFCRFDHDMHFQYWRAYEKRPEAKGDICDVMGGLGDCFFITRTRFYEQGGMDTAHGSWGGFGSEVSCKAWLSGGRQVVNKRVWRSHMFRTQGADFGFCYPISNSQIEAARQHSRDLWLNNKWPGQVRPLKWVIDHFSPVPDWQEPQGAERLAYVTKAAEHFPKGRTVTLPVPPPVISTQTAAPAIIAPDPPSAVLYYSDSHCDPTILSACQRQLRRACGDRPICCVSLQPIDFGDIRIVLPLERGVLTMFKQILAGLEALPAHIETVYFAEHDVLYSPEHYLLTPESHTAFYYNQATWKVDAATGQAWHYLSFQVSGLIANRQLLIEHYRKRVARVEAEGGHNKRMGYEPGIRRIPRGVDNYPAIAMRADRPNVDIRHDRNWSKTRRRLEEFRDPTVRESWTLSDRIPGWGVTQGRFADFLREAGR